MEKNNILTKILAITGTMLVWIPILAPLIFSAVSIIAGRKFRFDYLMPAELFPVTLVGSGLLIWAVLRVRSRRALKRIGWSLGVAIGLLVGGQGIAVLTGLAHGEADPTSGWRTIVLAMIIFYSLMVVFLGVSGVLFLCDLFKSNSSAQQDDLSS